MEDKDPRSIIRGRMHLRRQYELEMSADELAKLVSVSEDRILAWEGRSQDVPPELVPWDYIPSLARALKTTQEYLLGKDDARVSGDVVAEAPEEIPAKTTGEAIKQLREARGWSRNDLANKLDVSYQTVYWWETGKTSPPRWRVKELRKIFHCSNEDLCI